MNFLKLHNLATLDHVQEGTGGYPLPAHPIVEQHVLFRMFWGWEIPHTNPFFWLSPPQKWRMAYSFADLSAKSFPDTPPPGFLEFGFPTLMGALKRV